MAGPPQIFQQLIVGRFEWGHLLSKTLHSGLYHSFDGHALDSLDDDTFSAGMSVVLIVAFRLLSILRCFARAIPRQRFCASAKSPYAFCFKVRPQIGGKNHYSASAIAKFDTSGRPWLVSLSSVPNLQHTMFSVVHALPWRQARHPRWMSSIAQWTPQAVSYRCHSFVLHFLHRGSLVLNSRHPYLVGKHLRALTRSSTSLKITS